MKSIWTSLLFLHGHVTHRDLAWRPNPQGQRERKPLAAPKRQALACCAAVWPRLMGPR